MSDRLTNGAELERSWWREIRTAAWIAALIVVFLLVISFTLRAFGVGGEQRRLPGHTAAQVDTLRLVQDTVRQSQRANADTIIRELRSIRALLEKKP